MNFAHAVRFVGLSVLLETGYEAAEILPGGVAEDDGAGGVVGGAEVAEEGVEVVGGGGEVEERWWVWLGGGGGGEGEDALDVGVEFGHAGDGLRGFDREGGFEDADWGGGLRDFDCVVDVADDGPALLFGENCVAG